MAKRAVALIVLAIALLAVIAGATAVSHPEVVFRSAERDGDRVAEVLIAESVVVVMRTDAGGYSPLERAEIVAARLRAALEGEVSAADIQVHSIPAGHTLYVGDRLIVSVYESEASAHGATPEALARLWGDNIARALGLAPPPPATVEETPAEGEAEESSSVAAEPEAVEEEAVDWTGSAQKWVPIFSLESEGIYLGAAQIAGPKSQVDQVKGVAELRLNFRNLGRIYAYVPVRTIALTKLDRVQGVSVWATGDLKLVDF